MPPSRSHSSATPPATAPSSRTSSARPRAPRPRPAAAPPPPPASRHRTPTRAPAPTTTRATGSPRPRVAPARIRRDGRAYLASLEQVAPGRAAITGYCMGARLGLRIAAAYPDRVAALGAFHGGGLVTDAPDSPHLLAKQLKADLYFGHA